MRATTGPSWDGKTFILQFLKTGKVDIALFKRHFSLFYISTGGPQTATPALIKVHEIGPNQQKYLKAKNIQNWCNILGKGTRSLCRCQNSYPKGPFLRVIIKQKCSYHHIQRSGLSNGMPRVGQRSLLTPGQMTHVLMLYFLSTVLYCCFDFSDIWKAAYLVHLTNQKFIISKF